MTVVINGERREVAGDATVGDLVDDYVAQRRGVAVALDGEVLPRGRWDEVQPVGGTRLEILTAVQGG